MNLVINYTPRVTSRTLRIQITFASALSVLALSALLASALAQTTLPPVPVTPSAQDLPLRLNRSSRHRSLKRSPVAKARPKQAPPPAPVVAAPPTPAADPAPRFNDPGNRVPPGVILSGPIPVQATTAGPVQGYRALTATSSTKTATPIEQTPQSIQVIPRSVIEDQKTLTVDETLRNVSGAQGTNPLQTPAYEVDQAARLPGRAMGRRPRRLLQRRRPRLAHQRRAHRGAERAQRHPLRWRLWRSTGRRRQHDLEAAARPRQPGGRHHGRKP